MCSGHVDLFLQGKFSCILMSTCRRMLSWEKTISPLNSCPTVSSGSFLAILAFWNGHFSITYKNKGNDVIKIDNIMTSGHPSPSFRSSLHSQPHFSCIPPIPPAHWNQIPERLVVYLQIFQKISLTGKESFKVYSLMAWTYLKMIITIKYPIGVPITPTFLRAVFYSLFEPGSKYCAKLQLAVMSLKPLFICRFLSLLG